MHRTKSHTLRDPHATRIITWECRCVLLNGDPPEIARKILKCTAGVKMNHKLLPLHDPYIL